MNTQPEASWEIPIQDKVEEFLRLATDDGRGSVFDDWFDAQPPLVQVAYSDRMPKPSDWSFLARHIMDSSIAIRRFHETDWRDVVADAVARSSRLIGGSAPAVEIVALVGFGASNASAACWQGRGAAYLWFESWVGAAQPLINTDPDRLGVFVAHELFHAIRFTVAPLKAIVEDAIRRMSGPREFSLAALGNDPRDRMFEEGLATLFSLAAFPERADADALSLSPSELEWLRPRWESILGRHEPFWSGAQIDRREESLTRAFRKSASTSEPTMDQPPPTWAYYAGLELARRRVTGDWSRDVRATRLER